MTNTSQLLSSVYTALPALGPSPRAPAAGELGVHLGEALREPLSRLGLLDWKKVSASGACEGGAKKSGSWEDSRRLKKIKKKKRTEKPPLRWPGLSVGRSVFGKIRRCQLRRGGREGVPLGGNIYWSNPYPSLDTRMADFKAD